MTGIYAICFIIFPIAVFINIHKAHYPINEFLDRQDANVIKGMAACFVILAHLTIYLENIGGGYNIALKPFTVMGGMGVLLFFFLSGYGLYKGYGTKEIGIEFWKKRIINMYLPCVIIQLIFGFIWAIEKKEFDIENLVFNSLFGAWFVDVILIQYFIFFITWVFTKRKQHIWIALNFFINMIVAFVFWKLKFRAGWYNALMLFPFGMLIAYTEKKMIVRIERKWSFYFIASTILFGVSGMLFAIFKENVSGIGVVKTFSGICLSMLVCITFLRIKFCSGIMQYIGKRSLYFYVVHVNILSVLETIGGMQGIDTFYMVLILTFLTVIGSVSIQ